MYQKMTHTLEDLKKLAAMELRDVNREELVDMRAFLLYDQRATKSDSQTVQYGFHLSYHPSENFLFDFIAVQEKTVNFGI